MMKEESELSYVTHLEYAWTPKEVDVLDFNFKKIGTQNIWLRSYFVETGSAKLNEGRPYTLEWMLKRKHRFY